MADAKGHEESEKSSPPPAPRPASVPQHPTPSSFSAFRLKNLVCIQDKENLPSTNIAALWEKPLKISGHMSGGSSRTPSSRSFAVRRKGRGQPSPNRRNVLPPTKLSFDSSMESDGSSPAIRKSGYRRSLSHPEPSTLTDSDSNDARFSNPKRLKLYRDEISPYEQFTEWRKEGALSSKLTDENDKELSAQSSTSLTPAVKKLFVKSQSDSILSSCNIKLALEKIESNPNLIGDGSKSYILPLVTQGNHADLKEISGETLAQLLDTKEDIDPGITFKVIDCRYPYEYEGGHIRGALNLYTKKQVKEHLLEPKTLLEVEVEASASQDKENSREILIFHCEFSSKRAPFLCRYLRDIDRASNASSYPFLYYPEMYVLYGGYKAFFEEFPNLCDPPKYIPMLHPEHTANYRRFKSEAKFGP